MNLNSIMRMLFIEIAIIMISLLRTNAETHSLIDKLILSVSRDIPSIWAYKDKFPDISSLLLDEKCLKDGVAIDGKETRKRIGKMLESAISNKNVSVLIFGGSATLGADLGSNNFKLTYHYALADWWNKTIGSITKTNMNRKVVAVGGVGTTYFGHCWQEYVTSKEEFDYVTWEFAINDPDSLQYEKAVERFTRDILSMESHPCLTFMNFASKSKLTSHQANNCKRHEDEAKVIDRFAEHYSVTSIRWERGLCSCRKFHSKKELNKLFTKNHPKVIGHAQISFMLINYFKNVILDTLKERQHQLQNAKPTEPHFQIEPHVQALGQVFQRFVWSPSNGAALALPEPIYMMKNEFNEASTCYTSISPGPNNPPQHSLTSLTIAKNLGFTLLKESLWESASEERYDSTGGYITQSNGKSLTLHFHVNEGSVPMSQISVTVRNKYFGGRVKFTIDEGTNNEKIVHEDTSEKKKAGTNTIELGTVAKGTHTLSIYTETGGCNICALIVD